MTTPEELKTQGIQYFTKLFELGQYVRGWKGPGNEYVPLSSRAVREVVNDTFPLHLIDFNDFCDSLNADLRTEIGALSIMTYDQSGNYSKGMTINATFNSMCECRYPVFMASGHFMSTAVYYLKERYQCEIPNVDIKTLEHYC